MISNRHKLVHQQRGAADALSNQIVQFLAAGGSIAQLPSRHRIQNPPSDPTK